MKYLLFIILFSLGTHLSSQIQLSYVSPKQETYKTGDVIKISIRIKTRPETCIDGMKRVKTYVSGLRIDKLSDWKELAKGLWQAQITLIVIDSKKKAAKLTIMRRVDKEDLFKQENFLISN